MTSQLVVERVAGDAAEQRGRWYTIHPEAGRRLACLIIFDTLGPRAANVGPDLVELMKRVAVEHEHDPPRSWLLSTIARVCVQSPESIAEATRHEHVGVRIRACTVIQGMEDPSPSALKPALFERLGDSSLEVVTLTVHGLIGHDWVDEKAVLRMRKRIHGDGESDPRVRERLVGLLGQLEAHASTD